MKNYKVQCGSWKPGKPPKFSVRSEVIVKAENRKKALQEAKNMSRRERLMAGWDPAAAKEFRVTEVKKKNEKPVEPEKADLTEQNNGQNSAKNLADSKPSESKAQA